MLCLQCGVGHIVKDTFGAEVTMVCDSCGCLDKERLCESLECSKTSVFEYVSLEKKYRQNVDSSTSKKKYSYRSYIKEIKSCVDKYAYRNEAVKSRAENVFMKMMTEDNCQFKCKKRVAVACVYLALKEEGIPISIHSIVKTMGAPASKLNKVISRVKVYMHETLSSTENEVELALRGMPFIKENEKLIETALALFSLFDQFLLVSGRNPITVASACCYFAYISKQKKPTCISVGEFCRQNQAPFSGTNSFVRIAKERFLPLMQRIPWISANPWFDPKRHFHVLIDDVLRYKDALVSILKENESPLAVEALYMPPSLFRHMKRYESLFPQASTSEVLCEDDLPESEISFYLRNSEEVSKAETIQELLKCRSEETSNHEEPVTCVK